MNSVKQTMTCLLRHDAPWEKCSAGDIGNNGFTYETGLHRVTMAYPIVIAVATLTIVVTLVWNRISLASGSVGLQPVPACDNDRPSRGLAYTCCSVRVSLSCQPL
jgi:hypothetical protein